MILDACLTHANAGACLSQGLKALEQGDGVFDFAKVEVLDSCAISLILAWRRVAQVGGKQFTVANAPANLLKLADLYGVLGLLPLADA